MILLFSHWYPYRKQADVFSYATDYIIPDKRRGTGFIVSRTALSGINQQLSDALMLLRLPMLGSQQERHACLSFPAQGALHFNKFVLKGAYATNLRPRFMRFRM